MRIAKLLIVMSMALGMGHFALGTWCVQCPNLPECGSWGSTIGGPLFCGSEDLPTGCRRYTKQEYNCNGGGTGWKISSNLQVGDTCTASTDCF
jgi:hypothetical protein